MYVPYQWQCTYLILKSFVHLFLQCHSLDHIAITVKPNKFFFKTKVGDGLEDHILGAFVHFRTIYSYNFFRLRKLSIKIPTRRILTIVQFPSDFNDILINMLDRSYHRKIGIITLDISIRGGVKFEECSN